MNKIVKKALNGEERILYTSKVSLNALLGKIASAVLDSATFVATGIPRHSNKNKFDRGLLEIYLVLTNQSLLMFKTNFWSRPKELLFNIPISNIKNVKLEYRKIFWKLPIATLYLNNNKKIGFWSAKIHANRTIRLISKLEDLKNKKSQLN